MTSYVDNCLQNLLCYVNAESCGSLKNKSHKNEICYKGISVTNLGCVRGQYHTNNEQTQSVEGII